mgnify:CR=1 FL=1
MWTYDRKLQYPINIKNPNPAMAKFIISQYGGPDGEIGASLRYLTQRYSMPYPEVAAVLTDVGTEEIGHFEMVAAIVHQLTRDMTIEQIKEAGFEDYCAVEWEGFQNGGLYGVGDPSGIQFCDFDRVAEEAREFLLEHGWD